MPFHIGDHRTFLFFIVFLFDFPCVVVHVIAVEEEYSAWYDNFFFIEVNREIMSSGYMTRKIAICVRVF